MCDTHTYMVSPAWLELVCQHGAPWLNCRSGASVRDIWFDGRSYTDLTLATLDYELRVKDMDPAGVGLAIAGLTLASERFAPI